MEKRAQIVAALKEVCGESITDSFLSQFSTEHLQEMLHEVLGLPPIKKDTQ